MDTSSHAATPSAVTVLDNPSSNHPAYWPLYSHYKKAGRSATRALALLSEEWDVELLGPLPSERTARHWADVDEWAELAQIALEETVRGVRAYVEMQLLKAALEATETLTRIARGEFSNAAAGEAARRAAVAALIAAGFGPVRFSR